MFLAGHPSQGCFGLQSHCAPCYFFNQASFYPSDFSFRYGKEGLQLRKIEVPTAESEGISDIMPKTFNKKLLNALSDDDDEEVPFVDNEDGYPNWEEF
ncbi:hypothetical protein TNCV_4372501 [Trichonephila clavipes]|nr:hypothetical protein TNCV_4372501 [Trichonephila clavipes]